jgi:hypothetical protein
MADQRDHALAAEPEVSAQRNHAHRHDQRSDDLQRLAAESIHAQNGNYGESKVDRAHNDRLQQRGIGGHAHAFENIRRIIEHDVDADELLEDRQRDADENQSAPKENNLPE